MYWLEVSVVTDGEAAETVAEVLRPFAYQDGVVLEQLGDAADLDPNALEPAVTVKIYIPENEDTPALRRRLEEILYHLNRLYPVPAPLFRQLEEEDWANAWKAHYHPFQVGRRIWIQPGWLAEDGNQPDGAPEDAVVLTLDPGMAFGTGLHPTTQMCLQALEQLIQPGMRVLDVGTGSGILAIAAAKLGAASVAAVDTDEVAVQTAVANAAHNQVNDRVTTWRGSLDSVGPQRWDVVVVNILAPVIIALLREGALLGYVAPGGGLVLSGIVEPQGDDVIAAVHHAGGEISHTLSIRDWVTFIAHRP